MKITPTKVIHYGLLLVAAYIVYSWLIKGGGRDSYDNHPRNKDKFKDDQAEGEGHKYAKDVRHVKVEKEEPKQRSKDRHEPDRPKPQPKEKDDRDAKKKEVPRYKDESKEYEKEKVFEEQKEPEIEVKGTEEVKDVKGEVEEVKVEEQVPLKVKKKAEDGEDLLKEMNDAEIRGDKEAHAQLDHKLEDHENVRIPKLKKAWHEEHDDIEMAEEKKQRRVLFFQRIKEFEVADVSGEDLHFKERDNDFPFVTAAYSEVFDATITFVYSVQSNYPKSKIGIFDIGLSKDEVDYLKTLCSVEIVEDYISLFPKFMTENRAQKLWRPALFQIALSKYVHFVYLDPKRYLKNNVNLIGHFEMSRKGGVAMFGKLKSYSTAVVTNPEMYYYLAINVRKLLRMQHMELNMIIMHNSLHLQHYFTRWFMCCAREEYCIAPPGSKRTCNQNLYPKSKKYADCHRYDESALNILLASWHNYDLDHYGAEDFVTRAYDGRDSRGSVRVCQKKSQREL